MEDFIPSSWGGTRIKRVKEESRTEKRRNQQKVPPRNDAMMKAT